MKDEKKAPKLRFKGFTDDWEQCKLGDVCVITMGQSPNSNNYTDNPKDHILVQGNADMKDGQVYPRIWTTETTKTAKKGDLILTVRAPVGDVGKTGYDVVIGRGVAAIQGNEFIFQLLNRMKATGYWTKYSTGSTFESINSSEINNAVMHLPKKHEQIEVGNVLSYLDHTITLHEEKKRQFERIKSALLKKVFTDKSGYPSIRFEGFDKVWKQSKLGEITKVIPSKPYISTPSTHGNYLVIQQGDKPIAGFSDSKPFNSYNNITLFGDHTLSLFKPRSPFLVASDGIKILSPSIEMNGLFYFYALEKYKPQSEGYKRHFTILKKSEANFPTDIDEQKQISSLLLRIDNLIDKQQLRIDKLNETKKSLLQNMFI